MTFDPAWSRDGPIRTTRPARNGSPTRRASEQGTCVHLGDCDIGCPVNARNTLDLNYLALAEAHGADVRPLHLVRSIEPEPAAATASLRSDRRRRARARSETAGCVIVAAGSLGSTELLLRCRDVAKRCRTCPPRWARLERQRRLPDARHPPYARRVEPTRGPTITSAIDFLDGSFAGGRSSSRTAGFPTCSPPGSSQAAARSPGSRRDRIAPRVQQAAPRPARLRPTCMPWFAQGARRGRRRLHLRGRGGSSAGPSCRSTGT